MSASISQQMNPASAPVSASPEFDRRDTANLKALGIIAIVLHNFFHAVSSAQQNEFTFNPARFTALMHALRQPDLAVQALFSFFGHFGVQVFIFVSAYGLTKSHGSGNESWVGFMESRLRKLYPAFGIVVVPWFLVACIQHGTAVVVKTIGLQVALMFVGLSTFLPGAGLPPIGPWWFIPFIIQFYALWPLLRKIVQRFGGATLIVVPICCLSLVQILAPVLSRYQINLLETPIGRMPSICLGIAAARYGVRVPGWLAAIALPMLLLASRYSMFWRLATSAALVLWLWSYLKTRNNLRRYVWLERLGEYSLIIFLVNGIVRDRLVPLASTPLLQFALAAADLLICIAIAAILQPILTPAVRQTPTPTPA
jgi:peptidoglycan/LPS O-acetylase OafA/YrhL